MTRQKIEKELQKVRQQLADLQKREQELDQQRQMAEDAEKMKFIEKHKISLEQLTLLNKLSEEQLTQLLQQRSQKEDRNHEEI